MNRFKNILIITGFLLLPVIIFIFHKPLPCLFKQSLHIACPACGLSRALKELINLNIIECIKYNILAIPITITSITIIISLIKDTIKNKNKTIKKLEQILKKYYILIIIILIITTIINNLIYFNLLS